MVHYFTGQAQKYTPLMGSDEIWLCIAHESPCVPLLFWFSHVLTILNTFIFRVGVEVVGEWPAFQKAPPDEVPGHSGPIAGTDRHGRHPQTSVVVAVVLPPPDGGGHGGHAADKLLHAAVDVEEEAGGQQQEGHGQEDFSRNHGCKMMHSSPLSLLKLKVF